MDDLVGKTVLHYEILEQVGQGGMGTVYKAKDTKLDRFVALKFLPSQLATTEEEKARFIQEAKTASAMNHPNVCTIYDIQEYEGKLFIVMEFINGKTLTEKIDTLSDKQKLEIGIQASEGLAAAHDKGITHRDIKPDNIMIRKDGIVQIMDFGLAKLYTESNVSRLTKAGTTMGTMGYMSPEQVQGIDVDHRSDIFSLGVVLYELFAGESPFKGMHETAIMYEIVNVEAPPISTVKSEFDPELERLILECLEKDPIDRCQSAAELARNLKRMKRTSTGTRINSRIQAAVPVEKESKKEIQQTNKKLKIGIISLAVLCIVVIAAFLFIPKSTKDGINLSSYKYTPFETDGIVGGGRWSPDGKTVAFQKYINGNLELRVRSIDNPRSTLLTTQDGISNLFWSPDGNNLYFRSNRKFQTIGLTGGEPKTILSFQSWSEAISPDNKTLAYWTNASIIDSSFGDSATVFISGIDGTNSRRYMPDPFKIAGGYSPVYIIFSPDGSKIALTTYTSVSPVFWILPWPDGSNVKPKKIFKDIKFSQPPWFEWLPDSRRMVMTIDNGIWIGDTEDETLTRITSSQQGEYLSSVSKDGKRILFGVSNSNYNIVMLPFDGSPLKPLIATSVNEKSATISNDGKLMTYITKRTGKNEIWIEEENGQGHPIVTNADFPADSGEIRVAIISPDGKRVVYNRSGKNSMSELWVSNSEGGKPVLMFPDSLQVRNPSWSPDGQRLFASIWVGDTSYNVIKPIGNGETVHLPDSAWTNGLPSWSPNGKWIALKQGGNKKKNRKGRLLLISPDGKQSRFLYPPVDPSSWQYCIAWSKDSKKIYIGSSVEKISRLDVIDVRTGKSRKVAEYGYDVYFGQYHSQSSTASISRDGKGLIVSARFSSGSLHILDGALK